MTKSILIIGGGTFGTSTAYQLSLSRERYASITVLDRFPVPSCEAAGNDINKVIRADYPEAIYARLMAEAIPLWADAEGLYEGLYHRTGWFYAGVAGGSSMDFITSATRTAQQLNLEIPTRVSTAEIRRRFPIFTGAMPNWDAVWNSSAGWANARAALKRLADAAATNGVQYITGADGFVAHLLFDPESGRCLGARTVGGKEWFADEVVLAAGAAAAGILDMEGQLVAKGHSCGHLQLTREETEKFAQMPIMSHLEGGLVFPPQEDGIMKISAMHFVTNFSHSAVSLPRYRTDHPTDGLPAPIEAQLRKYMQEFLPELADRAWSETRLCWDADTADFHFLIDKHPRHANLSLAVGGSAHGFKFMPVIGKYIVAMMEGNLDEEMRQKWRWRPGGKLEGVNPHVTPLIELSSLPGWGLSERQSRL